MALFKIFKGNSSNLPKNYKDGYCYFTVNDGKMYIDTKDSDSTGRIVLNAGHADTATKATSATKLDTARTIQINLASTSTASFDGSANITPGVTGILPISNGGTGADTRLKAIKNLGVFGLYDRNEIGTSPNFDNPGVNGYFELRSKSETTGETGTKPYDGFGPFISINYSNTMFQLAGTNTSGFFIRGRQAANVTLAGVAWQKLLTSDNWSDYAAAKSHTHNNYVPLSGGTMTGSLATPGLAISNKSSQYVSLNMHGSGRFYFQIIPDSNSARNHLRYVDNTTGKYIDYYLGNDATSLSETKGYHILTGENYSSYALPLSGGTITGQLNVKGAFVAENTSYMYGSIISVGSGLYDNYNNGNYEMIVSYKNGNTVLGASGGGLYIGYQNTNYLNIGNLGNWAYWDASVLRLNQEIQSTNVHPLRSVYGDYGMIFRNDGSNFWFLPTAAGDQYGSWAKTYTRINLASGQIYGAVWNDYAEFRQYIDSEEIPYGRVVCENGDGSLSISTKRLQLGANICSDTFGQAIGEKDDVKMPIAVAGRVLAYPYEDRNSYIPGEPVCAGPNGTVSKMTREEIKEYPECIIGTVSEVPQYEEWNEIKVHGRIWIKVK